MRRSSDDFLRRELFDFAVQLRLPLIQLAMPRFGGHFSRFEFGVTLVPGRTVLVERGKSRRNLGIDPLNVSLAGR